jgi:DNA-binding SARP family transcriptional activator/predicted ATPase
MRIKLLGPPEVRTPDGATPAFATTKAEGLFYYLVAEKKTHWRGALAHLFWRDMAEAKARVNLSKALSNLRQQLGDYLLISTQTVEFNRAQPYWLDLERFQLDTGALQVASSAQDILENAQLYRGDFLDGFYVRNAPEFERWMLCERERLRDLSVQTFSTLATTYQEIGDYANAIHAWRRLLAIECWHENAHYTLMKLLVQTGEPLAALRQYEQCRIALTDELDVAPGVETTRLYERIRASDISTGSDEVSTALIQVQAHSAELPKRAGRLHNLPNLPTEFVGREKEVEMILTRLQDPACRLLTLMGPGGIGKTRLALEVGKRLVHSESSHFAPAGIFFVSLIPVHTSAGAISAIAKAIDFSFYGNVPAKQQLYDYIENKRLLLILDNFEHLMEQASLLSELLSIAPQLRIIVTSRHAIPLRWAHFHPVRGLPYPKASDASKDQVENDAVLLFTKLAQRHQAAFSLSHNYEEVIRICQLVDGMPLALELAAGWLQVLPCNRIIQELENNLDILATDMADVPDRHRSMRTVFAHTWQMLSGEEQAVLQKLAVFRGGFTLLAAKQVAQASLHHVASLAEKALIQLEEFGRYQLHELLRQFVHERLALDKPRTMATYAAHSKFFLRMVAVQSNELVSDRQPDVTFAFHADVDNIRIAWIWAAQNHEHRLLTDALDNLHDFYLTSCRYGEAQDLFAESLASIRSSNSKESDPRVTTVANLLAARKANFDSLLGLHEEARGALEALLATTDPSDSPREHAYILSILGHIASWQANPNRAEAYLQESLALYNASGDVTSAAYVLYEMAEMYIHSGRMETGARTAQACVDAGANISRSTLIGKALDSLGFIQFCLGMYEQSLENFERARSCFEKTDDRLGLSLAIGGMGLALSQLNGSRWTEAVDMLQQSLNLCRDIGHRIHTATRLFALGQTYIDHAQVAAAIACAEECIQVARASSSNLIVISGLYVLGQCYTALHDFSASREQLRQAAALSMRIGIYPLNHVAICYAMLLEQEANQLPCVAGAPPKPIQAIELATKTLPSPAWQMYRNKAEQLLERQKRSLPHEEFLAAQAGVQQRTLADMMSALLNV